MKNKELSKKIVGTKIPVVHKKNRLEIGNVLRVERCFEKGIGACEVRNYSHNDITVKKVRRNRYNTRADEPSYYAGYVRIYEKEQDFYTKQTKVLLGTFEEYSERLENGYTRHSKVLKEVEDGGIFQGKSFIEVKYDYDGTRWYGNRTCEISSNFRKMSPVYTTEAFSTMRIEDFEFSSGYLNKLYFNNEGSCTYSELVPRCIKILTMWYHVYGVMLHARKPYCINR